MEAIILAGGMGTRLKSVVSDVPKPMAPVLDRPFLTYILDNLADSGFTRVILAVGYKKEVIMDYFKNEYKGMDIIYSIENVSLGTGGCIKQAMSYVLEPFVFVINGDTMFNIDYKEMASTQAVSIACKYLEDFDRYGEVKIVDNYISSFAEKKYVKKGYINGGIYYLPKIIFDNYNLPIKFSLEKDFFTKYINELKIVPYLSNAYFLDIGIPEDYKKAQEDFKKSKALFLDRDGVINIDYGHVHKIEDFKFNDSIFDLCRKYQDLGYLLIVVTNQAGIAKKIYSLDDFLKLNQYMLEQFKKNGVLITNVYYCPHLPSDGCSCRKPSPGMFFKAIREYNLDIKECIAIGDKITDLEAASAAGISSLYYLKSKYETHEVSFKYKTIDKLDQCK